jgi:hypothetical protein
MSPERESHMPKSTGTRYTEEFKAEAVQLARSSPERFIRQLAYELGIADQGLRLLCVLILPRIVPRNRLARMGSRPSVTLTRR